MQDAVGVADFTIQELGSLPKSGALVFVLEYERFVRRLIKGSSSRAPQREHMDVEA
jgi:hypothetical protein